MLMALARLAVRSSYLVGAVAFLLGLLGVNGGAGGPECALTVLPGQSIQQGIESAPEGAVICLQAGTFHEHLMISKSLTLKGAGREQTLLKGINILIPVLSIRSDSEIQVVLDSLTIAEGRDRGSLVRVGGKASATLTDIALINGNKADGLEVKDQAQVYVQRAFISGIIEGFHAIRVTGSAQVTLISSQIRHNDRGLVALDASRVDIQDSEFSQHKSSALQVCPALGRCHATLSLSNSQVSDNNTGLLVYGFARLNLHHVAVSGNKTGLQGLFGPSAQISLRDSLFSGNEIGLDVDGATQVSLINTRVTTSKFDGLKLGDLVQAQLLLSVIEGNGSDPQCLMPQGICNGIMMHGRAQLVLIESVIKGNADWGIAERRKPCGYEEDDFSGQVVFEGMNTLEGNNQSGDHSAQGNPGNHPFTNLPPGNVCLP